MYNCYKAFVKWFILFILVELVSANHIFGIWVDQYIKKLDTKNVKRVKIIEYSFDNDNWKERYVMTAEYNDSGNLIKEARYTSDGILLFEYLHSYNEKGEIIKTIGRRMRKGKIIKYKYFYKYDQRGNQIESIGYIENGQDDIETSKYTARYDKNGNFIEGISYQNGVALSKYVAEYDERNNMINESKYKVYIYKGVEHYQLEYKNIYSYDNNNNLSTEKSYGNDGLFKYYYYYQYDDNNNLIRGISYAEDGSILSQYFAKYDINNNLVKSINYGREGEITSIHKAKYDENNKLIEEWDCTNNVPKLIYSAQYDKHGNLLEDAHYDRRVKGGIGLDYKYSYRYDSRNNCIEEIYYVFFNEENRWRPISRKAIEISYQN